MLNSNVAKMNQLDMYSETWTDVCISYQLLRNEVPQMWQYMWLKTTQFGHSLLGPLLKFSQGCHGISQSAFIPGAWGPLPSSRGSGNIQFLRSLSTCWISSGGHHQVLEVSAAPCHVVVFSVAQRDNLLLQDQHENLVFLSTKKVLHNIT